MVGLSWLTEPTVGALQAALRPVAPDLAEGTIVPRGLESNDDPRRCRARDVRPRRVGPAPVGADLLHEAWPQA